ncbi:MAG: bifunctional phosphoribosylaminoimidazolecarboxamide formyltransferase/IMP cyclohydrolase [Pirellulales bacterium]
MAQLSPTAAELGPPRLVSVRRALISVSDKSGLDDFAHGLAAVGVELFASGGTRKHLEQLGLSVRDVGEYTGFPEMLDGRVKTLHPKIHGGILCRHDRPDDMDAIERHGIVSFELVVVNLYPFEETVRRPDVTDAAAIENIDIGGPSLIRGAAKNHRYVTVATSAEQYPRILEQLRANGGTTYELRRELAAAAYARIAQYDTAIAAYFQKTAEAPGGSRGLEATQTPASRPGLVFSPSVGIQLQLKETLRYGENPHQRAALYVDPSAGHVTLVNARQLHGKELSYNNLLDLDSAWAMVRMLPAPAVVVIKHNNPCGGAMDEDLSVAMRRAFDGDPVSAFGSVIALNRAVNAAAAEVLAEPDRFVEAIVAPAFDDDALRILTTRPKWKANVRLMQIEGSGFRVQGSVTPAGRPGFGTALQYRHIDGGFLVQESDTADDPESEWKCVTKNRPTEEQLAELRFGWVMVRHVKSNAITLSKDRALVGVGAGQMSRVDSVEIAIRKAGDRARGSVLASDAFFPFGDSIVLAAKAGVAAIIQPGGSKRDEEVIAACNEHGLPMIFTGRRHFKH